MPTIRGTVFLPAGLNDQFHESEFIFRRMRPAGLPSGIGYFLIGRAISCVT